MSEGAYGDHNIDGLLQTEEHARALFAMRRPAFSEDEIERHVSARMARQGAPCTGQAPPTLTFVQEEVDVAQGRWVEERCRGQQLEHLLEVTPVAACDDPGDANGLRGPRRDWRASIVC